MFGGEIVKKIPFEKNFGLRKFSVQPWVQDKVGLRKFSPKSFFAKALKCHVWWRNCETKFPFEKGFGLRTLLVQDRVQDRVQDKVGLRKFSPKLFVKSLKMSCLMEKLWKKISLWKKFWTSKIFGPRQSPRQSWTCIKP